MAQGSGEHLCAPAALSPAKDTAPAALPEADGGGRSESAIRVVAAGATPGTTAQINLRAVVAAASKHARGTRAGPRRIQQLRMAESYAWPFSHYERARALTLQGLAVWWSNADAAAPARSHARIQSQDFLSSSCWEQGTPERIAMGRRGALPTSRSFQQDRVGSNSDICLAAMHGARYINPVFTVLFGHIVFCRSADNGILHF